MSKLYDQLLHCERSLKKILITKTVLSTHTTTTSQFRLKSYRMMVHAEIEYYIERVILDKVSTEFQSWTHDSAVPNVILNILAYTKCDFPNVSSSLSEVTPKNDIGFRINKAVTQFQALVKANNGIKEKDLIPMLVSLGVDYSRVSQTLLNNLSSFGVLRGEIAHNSIKAHNLINPADEFGIVSQILSELRDIDELISSA